MTFKKQFNNFLRFVYRVLSGIILLASILLLICIAIVVLFNFKYDISVVVFLSIVLIGIISFLIIKRRAANKREYQNQSWFFIKEILRIAVVLVVFSLFVINLQLPDPIIEKKEDGMVETEEVVLYTDSTQVVHEQYYQSRQTWYDFRRRKHSMKFRVDYDSVVKSKENRESIKWTDFRKITKTISDDKTKPPIFKLSYSWGKLYKDLTDHDKSLIEDLASEFYNYQLENKMNRREFAELMITAIQDIPYGLVLTDSCKVDKIKPCIGNIKFGLFAPAEYVSNLHGDCDTRTVILYTLLSRFNYDVAILSSKEYLHSMLGLNIPATGKYKKYKHKKYYFIETTSRGWTVGTLPKKFSNIDNWKIVLMHNTNI